MAHIVFIALYDEFCHGMRLLAGGLKAAGHRSGTISFKQYRQVPIEHTHEVWEECHVQVTPSGDQVNSYAYPASEKEFELLIDLLKRLDPDMIGIGFSIVQKRMCERLLKLIKEETGKPIIVGGPQTTAFPRWPLERGADWVTVGEADETILDIAKALDTGGDLRTIKNVGFLDEKGEVVVNPLRPLITDLDALAFPDYSENNWYIDHDTVRQGSPFPESTLNQSYIILTARGCNYHCSFCHNSIMNNLYSGQARVRERSVDRVMEELHHALKIKGGHFFMEILDSVFTLNGPRMDKFLKRYHREINMPFWCYSHPDCAGEEVVKPLAECPNCEFVIMGIQSASEQIGKEVFQRNHSNDTTLKAAETFHRHGVKLFVDMITNVPGETDAMCRENLDLLRRLPKPWRLRMTKLSLFPEYKVREKTGATKCVDAERYRLWNALYFLAQDVDLSDEEVDGILASELFQKHPEILVKMAGVYDQRACALSDTASHLRVRTSMLEVARGQLAERESELRDIKFRKGFRHFMRLSSLLPSSNGHGAAAVASGNGGSHGNGNELIPQAGVTVVRPRAVDHPDTPELSGTTPSC